MAQISGGHYVKWDKPGLESQEKKIPNRTCSHLHIESLRRLFHRRMENSDEEGLGRRMVSGEEEGPAGREGFYSTVW